MLDDQNDLTGAASPTHQIAASRSEEPTDPSVSHRTLRSETGGSFAPAPARKQFSIGRQPCALTIDHEMAAAMRDRIKAAIAMIGLPDDETVYRLCAAEIFDEIGSIGGPA